MAENELRERADEQYKLQSELHERMDYDRDLVNLYKPYSRLLDVNGHEIPNSVSIVLNDAAMFAWRVEAALNSAIEQIVVTAQRKSFDTDYIEDFLKAAFKEADRLLPLKDLFPLDLFLNQQTTRRGRVAARCTFKLKDGVLTPDILPYDTRFFTYWNGTDGLAGTMYKTTRNKSQILSEYPKAVVTENKPIEVQEIWSQKTGEVWIGDSTDAIRSIKNPYGEVPVRFRIVPMGSMLLDTESLVYHGESIFFLIRDLLPELNRLVSIIQSLDFKALDRALQLKIPSKDIEPNMKVGGHDEVTAPGTVNVVPSEGGYDNMPISELQASAQILHDMIQSRIDSATLNKLATLIQPKTATEILQTVQDQSDLIMPRLATRGLLKQELAYMMIRQTIMLAEVHGKSFVKMGNNDWEVSKLKGDYDIDFAYYFNDPKTDIARTSMAASQRGLISDYTIRRDTLQLQDPDGEEDNLRWEEAERLSPLVKMDRTIRALLKEAEDGVIGAEQEAMMLTAQLLPALRQAMSGSMTPPQSEEVKPSQPLVPMINNQGGV